MGESPMCHSQDTGCDNDEKEIKQLPVRQKHTFRDYETIIQKKKQCPKQNTPFPHSGFSSHQFEQAAQARKTLVKH